jgi:hypothetical protein
MSSARPLFVHLPILPKKENASLGEILSLGPKANILEWTLNTAHDFRARLRFPRVAPNEKLLHALMFWLVNQKYLAP